MPDLIRRTPFVGREREIERLRAAYDDAAAGQGSLVMVVGEPSIGKTALCGQLLADVAKQGGCALSGHCNEEGSLSLPYLPFVEALGAYVRSRGPAELQQELRRATSFDRLHLHGLGTREVRQILESIATQTVSPDLAEAVHDQTEGNPLFAQEVSRFLVEEGHLSFSPLPLGSSLYTSTSSRKHWRWTKAESGSVGGLRTPRAAALSPSCS